MMEPCSHRFTAAEGGARLAATATAVNTLVTECGGFIAIRLIHEEAYTIRGLLSAGRQRSVHLSRPANVKADAYDLGVLTDLKVAEARTFEDVPDWRQELELKEVLICTSQVFKRILEEGILEMCQINILVIDSCHTIYKDDNLQYIMQVYKQSEEHTRPRILAITYPLFDSAKTNRTADKANEQTDNQDLTPSESNALALPHEVSPSHDKESSPNVKELGVFQNLDDFDMYEKLEYKIDELEKALCCKMDLAEDIDGCKRISGPITKPKEVLIEYQTDILVSDLSQDYILVEGYMRTAVEEVMAFLEDHRHDPTEIYGEELYDEFKNIPNPTVEPKQIMKEFLYILEQLGPYAADRAAVTLLIKLEKLKIKVPYERHFLLLRLCTTTFVKIRCFTETILIEYDDWDKIRLFSTPKLLRLIEILEKFTPPDLKASIENGTYVKVDRRNEYNNTIAEIDQKNDCQKNVSHKNDSPKKKCRTTERANNDCRNDSRENDCRIHVSQENDCRIHDSQVNDCRIHDSQENDCRIHDSQENDCRNHDSQENDCRNHDSQENDCRNHDNQENDCRIHDSQKNDCRKHDSQENDCQKHDSQENDCRKYEHDSQENDCRKHDSQENDCRKHDSQENDCRIHDSQENVCGKNDGTSKLLHEIDNCDFTTLGNKIEDRLNVLQANLKDLDVRSDMTQETQEYLASIKTQCGGVPSSASRRGGRARGRRPPRATCQHAADALCALVFVHEPFMAKVLFNCIVDVSRIRPAVSYINSQFCAVETSENKETPKQGRRHEEVLKKFRMHECNLLLTTSALEEGIDLPRCNLVLRWDVPPSYRSYVLCRSRSRAVRSGSALLVASSHTDDMLHCLATYKELDQMITRKCGCGVQDEPSSEEESHADTFNCVITPYMPAPQPCVCSQRAKLDVISHTRTISDSENDACDVNVDVNEKSVRFDGSANINDVNNDLNKKIDKISDVFGLEFNIDEKSVKFDDDSETSDEHDVKLEDHTKIDVNYTTVNGSIVKMDENDIADENKKILREHDTNLDKNHLNVGSGIINLDSECLNNGNDAETSESDAKNSEKLNVNRKSDNRLCKCNNDSSSVASVDLNSAIALINRYCAKLPSDTFTRLAPQWWIERVRIPDETRDAFICTLRLPLNCPVKYNIVGHPMPTRVLARRMVALQACRILHMSGELDNQLLPIGKENFKAMELESAHPVPDMCDDSARPGTTKRRQYYYKRTAWAFTDCQPVVDTSDTELDNEKTEQSCGHEQAAKTNAEEAHKDTVVAGRTNLLYSIECELWCALPERYNTRGRRLHAPQHACQALAVLMAREEPTNLQIPAFPVYTRSGEVRVSVEQVPDADVRVTPRRKQLIQRFMQFVFTEVLRVRRRGMTLDSEGSVRNNYYIVPTIKSAREDGSHKIDIDWAFLEQIYNHTEQQNATDTHLFPTNGSEGDSSGPIKNPLLKDGEVFSFDADRYQEAVVTPWYRNQDQPQFFLVAEICSHLTPDSAFPSPTHDTFRSYYRAKYRAELTQPNQPLLDVDHTSARLNLLTPRYVNRKGVALPVSSERTRRAKRDRLDQKQILVPELCTVHPFAAPLWFATVALPCVLYRINALLIADEIRRAVAIDVGLGIPKIDENTAPGFQWPPLDFGWCLAEVLSADVEKTDKKKDTEPDEQITELQGEPPSKTEIANAEDEGIDKELTINEILQEEHEKLNQDDTESGFEIGTWSNDMASSIPETDDIYDEWSEPLPTNLTFCTAANGGVNWCDPVQKPKPEYSSQRAYTMAESDCSYLSSDFDSDDSDFDVETDTEAESGFGSSKAVNASLGVRIEYKTAHEAEAVDVEVSKQSEPAPQRDLADERRDRTEMVRLLMGGAADDHYIQKFRSSVESHKQKIKTNGQLVPKDKHIYELLPDTKDNIDQSKMAATEQKLQQIFPYNNESLQIINGQISIQSIEKNKRHLLKKLKDSLDVEEVNKLNCFYMKDIDIDAPDYVNEKIASIGFDSKEKYLNMGTDRAKEYKPYYQEGKAQDGKFHFDYQPDLEGHPGPSPSVILQALTMSNANDGINLERLETIGDSFLKFAITAYLYCAHPTVHEGKLSHMRSKQVSNLNLYRLGRAARLGARMIASKFEPHDNWLPPCHKPPPSPHEQHKLTQESLRGVTKDVQEATGCYIPYNLITQHSIPDKSIADCVEALIGAYLLECGARGALLFMAWLGISVLPHHVLPLPRGPHERSTSSKRQRTVSSSTLSSVSDDEFDAEPMGSDSEPTGSTEPAGSENHRPVGARKPYKDEDGKWYQIVYGELKAPPSPLLRYIQDPEGELERMLSGYDALEDTLQYRFKDRSLLLQALTHASHQKNTLTDCYQRLEFLGDAILDYLITRHLYEDPRRHSPGALTDLRSALVNNTIFATLAVRHGFHKYFRHMSPGLNEVLMKYVKVQEENGHSISEEHYLIQEDELEQAEDVEVPKALGDLFESIAGAIFLDSGMSLGAVWGSYVRLMGAELEAFSAAAPKSPVRELLEAEPDTAKFSKPERLADGRRVRVCVEVFGRGTFKGVGRNYRIAKGTAARCALRHLRKHRR